MKKHFTVTFDTNVLDKSVCPGLFPADPASKKLLKINAALKEGEIFGYFCDSLILIEALKEVNEPWFWGRHGHV